MDELTKVILESDISFLILSTGLLLAFKDLLSSFVNGLLFKIDRTFNIGDNVVINGQNARIINIGFRQTIFEIEPSEENGNQLLWMYVYNERVRLLDLGIVKHNVKGRKHGESAKNKESN